MSPLCLRLFTWLCFQCGGFPLTTLLRPPCCATTARCEPFLHCGATLRASCPPPIWCVFRSVPDVQSCFTMSNLWLVSQMASAFAAPAKSAASGLADRKSTALVTGSADPAACRELLGERLAWTTDFASARKRSFMPGAMTGLPFCSLLWHVAGQLEALENATVDMCVPWDSSSRLASPRVGRSDSNLVHSWDLMLNEGPQFEHVLPLLVKVRSSFTIDLP